MIEYEFLQCKRCKIVSSVDILLRFDHISHNRGFDLLLIIIDKYYIFNKIRKNKMRLMIIKYILSAI